MGLFSSSEFDELSLLVEKATSEYIPAAQEDLALNLEITDIIKSKRVSPKDALRLLLTRLTHDNPNVQLLSLNLFDKCVKNGGKHFLVEMAGREFVDVAVCMMDDEEYGHECNQMVQDRLIELFQEWALLFQSDPSLAYLYDTYCNLKATKRVIFPIPAKSLDHIDPLSIVSSTAPPEWSDSPSCQRCRDQFTMTNRKHHCRKCGGTFCQLCSSNEMVLLEMGINEPVRVCDTCYRQPVDEKRRAKIFEKKPQFEDSEDAELKKAIELSLKDQQQKVTMNVDRNEDEEALKKAIEASLKEAGPNHMTTPPAKVVQTIVGLNPVEVENISMFHQLIGRLVRTRPQLTQEDVQDLQKLAGEMRRLQKRPIEDQVIKNQLEESLKGYELMFGTTNFSETTTSVNTNSRQQVQSPPSSLTEDLNTMKTEVLGDTEKGPEIGLVRTRLGSLSLENQLTEPAAVQQVSHVNPVQHVQMPAYHTNTPPSSAVSRIHEPMPLAPSAAYQASIPSQPSHPSQHVISPPLVQHQPSYRHSLPAVSHHHPVLAHPRMLPLQSTPIQMCPDMTVHPHPIHPSYTHVNPYADGTKDETDKVKEASGEKKKKVKKSKKDKFKDKKKGKSEIEKKVKSEDEKKRRKKHKVKDEKEKKPEKEENTKKKKKTKDETSETTPKKKKSKTEKKTKKSESGEKRIKSIKMEIAVESKDNDNIINSVDEGRKSPINLIDL